MNRPSLSILILAWCVCLAEATEPKANQGPNLSLREAVDRTRSKNPALRARPLEEAAALAHTTQAGARPNPVLDLSVENAPGTGRLRGGSAAETTLQLGQVFEWPSKRRARVGHAESLRSRTEAQSRVVLADTVAGVCDQFAHVLGDQHRLALAEENRMAAEKMLEVTRERLLQGAAAEWEERRARVVLARARIAEEHAEHELAVSKRLLASYWGGRQIDFGPLVGDLFAMPELPPFEELAQRVKNSPAVLEWGSERAVRAANLRLVEARARPDITFGVGGRRLEQEGEFAGVARLSIPLPLFDRLQGPKKEAALSLEKSDLEQEQTELHLEATLFDLYEELGHHRTELEMIKSEILPASEEAMRLAQEAHLVGKLSHLELLDAHKTLIEIQQEQVMAGEMFHRLLVHMERLLGAPVTISESDNQ